MLKKIILFSLLLCANQIFAQEKPFKTLNNPAQGIIAVGFSTDSKLAATAGMNHQVNLWDINNEFLSNTFKGHKDWVVSLVFSPDSKYIVTGSKDKTAKVWEIKSGTEALSLKGHEGTVSYVCYSSDGNYIATASTDQKVRIYDAYAGALLRTMGGHKKEVLSLTFSNDNTKIASVGADNQLIIWNVADGSTNKVILAHNKQIRCVAYSPDSKYLLTASDDKQIKIWDVENFTNPYTIKVHSNWVQSAKFTPDAKYVISAGHDNSVYITDFVTGKSVYNVSGGNSIIYDCAISPNGKTLTFSDFTDKLKIYDIAKLDIKPIDIKIATRSMDSEEKVAKVETSSMGNDLDFDPGAKGKNYLLIIGIGKYTSWPQLGNAVKDALDVKKVLLNKYAFEKENMIEIYDEKATVQTMFTAFTDLKKKITPKDNLMIYFSGHGFYNPDLEEGYWIPVNAKKGVETDYLPNASLLKYIKAIDTQHTFLVADACFSGSLFSQGSRGYIENVENVKSRWGLTSGRLEYVSDGQMGKNSPFCTYFLKYLESNQKKKFPVSEIVQYVKTSVSNNSDQTPVGNPLSKVGDEGGEFVFYLK